MTYLAVLIFGMGLESGLLWAFPNEVESSGASAVMDMMIGSFSFVILKLWLAKS